MQRKNPIGEPFVELDEVPSTNNYAMAKAQAQLAEHGAAWFANQQFAGKGQRGKVWSSEAGHNIILSVLVEPTGLQIINQFYLSMAIAVACQNLFGLYALGDTKIKWPNDIYWKDRKAGGILIENIVQGGEWKYAIVGIGININQTIFPPDLPNAVSLKQITGQPFKPVELAKQLCNLIEDRWQQLKEGKTKELAEVYNADLYKRNEVVSFRKENAVFSGVVQKVEWDGSLVVNTGTEIHLSHGSAEWVI